MNLLSFSFFSVSVLYLTFGFFVALFHFSITPTFSLSLPIFVSQFRCKFVCKCFYMILDSVCVLCLFTIPMFFIRVRFFFKAFSLSLFLYFALCLAISHTVVCWPIPFLLRLKYSLGFLVVTLCGWHNLKFTVLLNVYLHCEKMRGKKTTQQHAKEAKTATNT